MARQQRDIEANKVDSEPFGWQNTSVANGPEPTLGHYFLCDGAANHSGHSVQERSARYCGRPQSGTFLPFN